MIFLVLEDNVEIAEDIVKTINSIETDSKVLVAPTIREGFELAKRNEIDVFLIDIHLPDGNGIDFSRKIREDYEQHPIITISDNYSDEAQLRMFREVKGLAYLPKPFRREELIEEISNAIKLATLIDDKTLTIKMKKTVYVFKVSEIVYIERTDSKELSVARYDSDRGELVKVVMPFAKKIDTIFDELERPNSLIKCSQSIIINPVYIIGYDITCDDLVLRHADKELRVGSTCKMNIAPFITPFTRT